MQRKTTSTDKKHPSPLTAIRLHCLDCCLNQPAEVHYCGATSCPSQPLRFGKKVQGLNVLQTIKEHCIECGGHEELPKNCGVNDCALWPFREGKNPNRAGIGNTANFQKLSTETQTSVLGEGSHAQHQDTMSSSINPQSCGEKECLKAILEVNRG